jgi:hypothetical protein
MFVIIIGLYWSSKLAQSKGQKDMTNVVHMSVWARVF